MADVKRKLSWFGGNPGDGWFEMSRGLVEIINAGSRDLELELVASGGRQNVEKIESGNADFAMSIDVVVSAARNGGEPFTSRMGNLNVLGTGWSALPYNLLKGSAGPDDLLEALRQDGLRFGAPPEDTTDELVFRRVLAFCDTSYKDITQRGGGIVLEGYDALVDALADGRIDYLFGATTLPASSIARAALRNDLRLVSLPRRIVSHLAHDWGHGTGVIPEKTYPSLCQGDISTSFVQTVLLARSTADEKDVHAITKALLKQRKDLVNIHPSLGAFNPRTAWRNVPAPMHPGASRAFQELGFMA